MSTLTATPPTADQVPAPAPRRREPNLYSRYVGAMLYFMGAALIAGAVVHYPIDPQLYTVICVVGALVFLLGTIVNEFILAPERPALGRAVSLVTFSLLLSFGVGMVGGGIQHFTQFPERSAAMIPIGLVMSYGAFVAKDAEGRWKHVFSLFGAGFLLVTLLSWAGASALASTLDTDGHGHDHGTSGAARGDAPAAGTPVEGGRAPAEREAAPAEPHQDSHSH